MYWTWNLLKIIKNYTGQKSSEYVGPKVISSQVGIEKWRIFQFFTLTLTLKCGLIVRALTGFFSLYSDFG